MASPVVTDKVIPAEIRAAVAEFVANAGRIPGLACAVLYGSVVRGELHPGSDVDLFLLFDGEPESAHGQAFHLASELADEAMERTGCPHWFSCLSAHLDGLPTMGPHFLYNVIREGVVIWARPDFVFPPAALGRTPHLLIAYRPGDGTYEGPMHDDVRRVADGVLLAPTSAAEPILAALRQRGAQVTTMPVWAEQIPYRVEGEAMKAESHFQRAKDLETSLDQLLAAPDSAEHVALITEAVFGIAMQYIAYGLEIRYGEHPDTHAGMPKRLKARGHHDIAALFEHLTKRRMGLWYGDQEDGKAVEELRQILKRIRAWAIGSR